MAVYVDSGKIPYGRMLMSHMLADTPEELHAMADRIGVRRKWFQPLSSPHYDVCQEKRQLAIEAGAVIVGRKETVAVIRRIRSLPEVSWHPGRCPSLREGARARQLDLF